MGPGRLGMTSTNSNRNRVIQHVILVGFSYSAPASRFPSYGGSIYYCHVFRAFKCCKLLLCEYPEFLKY